MNSRLSISPVSGTPSLYRPDGTRKINVINLNKDKRVTVLERTLGIASHDVTQAPDGTIRVEAQMGFSKETVNDSLQAYDAGLKVLSAAK